jgi:hypothetical protein
MIQTHNAFLDLAQCRSEPGVGGFAAALSFQRTTSHKRHSVESVAVL